MTSVSQIDGVVTDYFVLENHLLSTRSADAYRALERSRQETVTLWMLRHPLAANSDALNRFVSRMKVFYESDPKLARLLSYGVDSAGTAFAVMPHLDGHIITSGNLEPAEAERRYISALRTLEQVHVQDIACGDLCGGSFWVDRAGAVEFIGIMGSFDSEAAATAMAPPQETLPYFPPELRTGGGIERASDVFSLGVLGYRLMTGYFPFETAAYIGNFDIDSVKPLGLYMGTPPVWGDEVLLRCLNPDPQQRFDTAGDVLKEITGIRTRAVSGQAMPAKVQRDPVLVSRSGAQEMHVAQAPVVVSAPVEVEPKAKGGLASNSIRVAVLGIAVITAFFLAMYSIDSGPTVSPDPGTGTTEFPLTQPPGSLEPLILETGNKAIDRAMQIISSPEVSLVQKQEQLEVLAGQSDIVAHKLLVKTASASGNEELRRLAEQAVVDRARRLGLMRSAEQVRQWLRNVRAGQLPPHFETVLMTVASKLSDDPDQLSSDARPAMLRRIYARDPFIAMRLAAALALDTGSTSELQPLVAQLVGDALKVNDAKNHSLLALILAEPRLAVIFGDDVVQRKDQIPDKDILWLLRTLADRNDINVRSIASAAVERDLLSPVRSFFLSIVRDRGDLPPDILNSLIRAAGGVLRVEDMASFGRWYDRQSEEILLAIIADVKEPELLTEAFDTLAGKSLVSQPGASLVEWARTSHWDRRAELARPIGIIANLHRLSKEDALEGFKILDSFAKDREIVRILMNTNDAFILNILVEQYPGMVGLGGLINLLGNKWPEVRVAAVRALKGTNDIGALKLIIDKYEEERDPEVRAVYQETFWVIKEREMQ